MVRFGKGNRRWATAGRRLLGERREADAGAIASAERDALLEAIPEGEASAEDEEEVSMAGDPTQHLLTALGRFQRQVSKAESGAPPETWTDECMNQIIRGIEIAFEEGWGDVKEALTDTARVLETYEEAGRSGQCVPFLQDSYEILCLMVGDLIVDTRRSGVIHKWRDRYNRAVEDLSKAGLTLVDDEEPGAEAASMPAGEQAEPATEAEAEWARSASAAQEAARIEPKPDAEEASEAEDASVACEEAGEEQAEEAAEAESGQGYDAAMEEEAFFELEAAVPERAAEEQAIPDVSVDEASPFEMPPDTDAPLYEDDLPTLDSLMGEAGDAGSAAEVSAEAVSSGAAAGEEAIGEEIKVPCAAEAERDTPDVEGSADDTVEEQRAAEEGAESGVQLGLEAPFDVASGSGSDAQEGGVGLDEESAVSATAGGMEGSVAAEEAEAEATEGTPGVLLRTAQAAMARGDVSDAKVLALQLAANMARLEVERFELEVERVGGLIEENARAIEAAKEHVGLSEKGVQDAEWHIGERQAEFEQKRGHADSLREQVEQIQGEIGRIDEQLRTLQQERDEAAARMTGVQGELEEALSAESRVQTELDSLAEAEASAREALSHAQERVAGLEEERASYEADLAQQRKEAEGRRHSASEIERMFEEMT